VLVARFVEVVGAQALLADGAHRVTRQQDGAEHGLLGLEVVRGNPVAGAARVTAITTPAVTIIPPVHRATFSS
jgi:hypothetical protein